MDLSALADLPGLAVHRNEPLARFTRFALGGPAQFLIDAFEPNAFLEAHAAVRASGLPSLVLGGGSNLVVADQGFAGVILRYRASRISAFDSMVYVESGADLEALVDFSIAHSLAGLESLKRIPGWVGGAIYGNAGAYGQQINERVMAVRVFDGQGFRQLTNEECGFDYRTSGFKQRKDWIICSATLRLTPGDPHALAARAEEIRAIRDEKFPPSMRCAGSIFKNLFFDRLPDAARARVPREMVKGGKVPSAWFLEQAGAKGMRRGDIQIAVYHANLLYADGPDAKSADVVALIDELQTRVQAEFGFRLEPEVQFVGFPDRVSY